MYDFFTGSRFERWAFAWLCIAALGCGGHGGETMPGGSASALDCRPTATSPHANGMTCGADADCASCSCMANKIGEHRCYGTADSNDVCKIDYDCDYGLCFSDGDTKRCVDVTWCEASGLDSCFKDLALATCRAKHMCDPSDDFSNCVSFQCSLKNYLPIAQCQSELKRLQGATRAQCSSTR